MVATEAFVFLLSADDRGGDSGFLLELFRDNQDGKLGNFLGAAGCGGRELCFSWAGGGGGGGKLTGDILPERPCRPVPECSRGGSLGSRSGAFAPSV